MGKINDYGTIPPQAIDVEEIVIGAILLDGNVYEEIQPIIKSDDFYKQSHQLIFNAINEMYDQDEQIDLLTVSQKLQKHGTLEDAGGAFVLSQYSNRVASSAHIESHARIIKQKSIRRKIIHASSNAIKMCYDDTFDVFDNLQYIETELTAINSQLTAGSVSPISSVVKSIFEDCKLREETNTTVTGVPSGFKLFDTMTGGFSDGNMITVAGRPGMGKTTAVLQIAKNASRIGKKKVGIITLEMTQKELTSKIISSETRIDYKRILKQFPTEAEYFAINNKMQDILGIEVYFIDKPSLTERDFKIECRKLVREFGCDMIIIDYLQLMHTHDKKGTREQEISTISRAIKSTAKHLEIPIIALSQLSRSVEQRGGDKRPMLSDLRESGAIEQDSDMVVFLYRPEYYDIFENEDGESTQGVVEWIIAKHRGGDTGTIPLHGDLRYSVIQDERDEYNAGAPMQSKEFDLPPMKQIDDEAPF